MIHVNMFSCMNVDRGGAASLDMLLRGVSA